MGYKKFTVGGTHFPEEHNSKNTESAASQPDKSEIQSKGANYENGGISENTNAHSPAAQDKSHENTASPISHSLSFESSGNMHMHEPVTPSCATFSPQKSHSNTPLPFGSTSEIKVKSNFQISENKRNKRKVKKAIIRAMCVFSAAAVISAIAIAPIPQPIELPLKLLAEYLTGKGTVSVLSSKNNENILSENKTQPAFTESSMSDEKNVANQQTEAPPQAMEIDLSAGDFTKISNETQYTVSVANLMNEAYPIDTVTVFDTTSNDAVEVFAEDGIYNSPEVLIIHTHGTESYSDTAANNYRSQNIDNNVVSIGKKLTRELTERGLSVIHCEKMFDAESYINAYSNSFSAVSEYLTKYPSIKYIIDLHRDAIPSPDGGYAKLSSQINGTDCAQLMMVVGTDEAGASHPGWKSNLRTVLGIQAAVGEKYPGLMRSVNLRRASFNQQLSPGYFILEAGNCGNSAQEVMNSIPLFAECFCDAAVNSKGGIIQ